MQELVAEKKIQMLEDSPLSKFNLGFTEKNQNLFDFMLCSLDNIHIPIMSEIKIVLCSIIQKVTLASLNVTHYLSESIQPLLGNLFFFLSCILRCQSWSWKWKIDFLIADFHKIPINALLDISFSTKKKEKLKCSLSIHIHSLFSSMTTIWITAKMHLDSF